jgi:beta-glucanase (GH16 family)
MIVVQARAAENCEPNWADEFSDSLNTDVWNIVEGDGCAQGLCGWGNKEVQWYAPDAVAVEDGMLRLTAFSDDKGGIRSGKLTTAGKFSVQYGVIEASMRLPAGRGYGPHSG